MSFVSRASISRFVCTISFYWKPLKHAADLVEDRHEYLQKSIVYRNNWNSFLCLCRGCSGQYNMCQST